jgi:hypothetical protein
MKHLAFALVFLAGLSAQGRAASTPEEVVDQYFQAFRSGDLEGMAALMHPEELAVMQQELVPVIAHGIDKVESGTAVDPMQLKLFADTDSIDTISSEPPDKFFVRFMNWVGRMNPMMQESMRNASIETIGHVMEGDEIAHVVYRIRLMAQGARVSQMNVMPAKKNGDEWRLMLSGEIRGISELLKKNMPRF